MTSFIFRQIVLCFALVFSGSLFAAEVKQNPGQEETAKAVVQPSDGIDPFVVNLIRQASDYLSSAKSFSLKAHQTTEEVLRSGQKIQLSRSGKVLVRLPDRMYTEAVSDKGTTRFYYDGKTMSRFDLEKNIYASIDVPDTLEAALDHAMLKFHVDAPLADFLAGNLYDNFISNTDSGFYAGLHYLDGEKYHHLALSNQHVDFQIWITDSVEPLIRKIVITYKHLKGVPQYTAYLSDWDFNPRTPDMLFDFYPPIDADEIEFIPVATGTSGEKQ